MPHNPIAFTTDGFYILLSDIGSERQFHWALYLAKSPSHGVMFHVVNNEDTGHVWRYRAKSSTGVPNAVNLLFALKIGVMEPVLHDPLADRLHAVPVILPTTCRVWLKRALQDLDEEGYIKLTGKIQSLEQEATLAAAENKLRNKRSVEKSLNFVF